ncbi:MAG: hypothetical protein J6K48_03795 [Lachnospiraceae bacterium]|nr:hypothetical protein [Lachnospiraceae bacterium]
MAISRIGATGYPAGYETRKTERNTTSKSFADQAAEAVKDKIDYDEKAFESVGPNAPENVKQAWMEAAKETGTNGLGMMQNGMLSHISQMAVQRAIDWYNGKADPQDILGNTVQSALNAAKKALYDLENPLEPVSHKRLEVQQQIMKEKEFYKAFISKLENFRS